MNSQGGYLLGTDFRRQGSELGSHPHQAVTVELSSKYYQEKQQSRARESGGRDSRSSPVWLLVLSAKFKGKLLLQRKQLGNTRLAEELLHIHAFEQKTLTPEQWAREQQK